MSDSRTQRHKRCAFDDCDRMTRGLLGYCTFHVGVAHACAFDDECKNRCAAYSRSRLCADHAWFARKVRG